MQKELESQNTKRENNIFRPLRVGVAIMVIIGLIITGTTIAAFTYRHTSCTNESIERAIGMTKVIAGLRDDEALNQLASEGGYEENTFHSFFDTCMETSAYLKSLYTINQKLEP
jgi:hypothetical protein